MVDAFVAEDAVGEDAEIDVALCEDDKDVFLCGQVWRDEDRNMFGARGGAEWKGKFLEPEI